MKKHVVVVLAPPEVRDALQERLALARTSRAACHEHRNLSCAGRAFRHSVAVACAGPRVVCAGLRAAVLLSIPVLLQVVIH